MISIIQKIKPYLKPIGYTILALIFLYVVILIATRKPQIPIEYKQTLDSLTKANIVLQQKQIKLDSAIATYENKVDQVDIQIDNIKEKTTIVKEYHHEIIQQVDHYNATEVEQFFKTRYNY